MIEAIENNKISAVFVKDLSRLGRNYIEVGRLTEEFFPEYDIRLKRTYKAAVISFCLLFDRFIISSFQTVK